MFSQIKTWGISQCKQNHKAYYKPKESTKKIKGKTLTWSFKVCICHSNQDIIHDYFLKHVFWKYHTLVKIKVFDI